MSVYFQPLDAEQCFKKRPTTAMSLQLAMYYYALQIYRSLPVESVPHPDPAYLHSPTDIIKRALKLAKKCQSGNVADVEFTPTLRSLTEELLRQEERFMDFTQAQALQALGRGV